MRTDYELFCGLALNLERTETRAAARVLHGAAAAFSGRPQREFFHAQGDDPELAEVLYEQSLAAWRFAQRRQHQ